MRVALAHKRDGAGPGAAAGSASKDPPPAPTKKKVAKSEEQLAKEKEKLRAQQLKRAEEVKTVFVWGLPADFSVRKLRVRYVCSTSTAFACAVRCFLPSHPSPVSIRFDTSQPHSLTDRV